MSETQSTDQPTAAETPVITDTSSSSEDNQPPEQPNQPQQEEQKPPEQQPNKPEQANKQQEQQKPPEPSNEEKMKSLMNDVTKSKDRLIDIYGSIANEMIDLEQYRQKEDKPIFVREESEDLKTQIRTARAKHTWDMEEYGKQMSIISHLQELQFTTDELMKVIVQLISIRKHCSEESHQDIKQLVDTIKTMINLKASAKNLYLDKSVCTTEEINDKILLGQILSYAQSQQIEIWTSLKLFKVLFSSQSNDWNTNELISIRLMNKENLLFIIEDENGNIFGGFVHDRITSKNVPMNDPRAFLFSLKTNNRFQGMLQFFPKENEPTFTFNPSDEILFSFGKDNADLTIYNQSNKEKSKCTQQSFNYYGISNTLCGGATFIPKHFYVIEMKPSEFQ